MSSDVALQEDRYRKARRVTIEGDVPIGCRIDGVVGELDVAGQLGAGLELVLETGLQHLLDCFLIESHAVTLDRDGHGEAGDLLADFVVWLGRSLHPVPYNHERLARRFALQLVRHLRHGVFRIDVTHTVDVGLLDDGRRSSICATICGLWVGHAEIVVIVAFDVGDRARIGVPIRTSGNGQYGDSGLARRAHHRYATLGSKFLASGGLDDQALGQVLNTKEATKAEGDVPRSSGGIDLLLPSGGFRAPWSRGW